MPDRGCSVEGCERSHAAKGLCKMHYYRLRNTGSTGAIEARPEYVADGVTNRCGRCKQDRPVVDFPPSQQRTTGAWCRDCKQARYQETHPAPPTTCIRCGRPIDNPHGKKVYCSHLCRVSASYWRANPAKALACIECGEDLTGRKSHIQYCSTRCAQRNRMTPAKYRAQMLWGKYRITTADYDALLLKQGGVCAICKGTDRDSRDNLMPVDHCHTTGAVRGILCGRCNLGLGMFGDRPEVLDRAAAYLRRAEPPCTTQPPLGLVD